MYTQRLQNYYVATLAIRAVRSRMSRTQQTWAVLPREMGTSSNNPVFLLVVFQPELTHFLTTVKSGRPSVGFLDGIALFSLSSSPSAWCLKTLPAAWRQGWPPACRWWWYQTTTSTGASPWRPRWGSGAWRTSSRSSSGSPRSTERRFPIGNEQNAT